MQTAGFGAGRLLLQGQLRQGGYHSSGFSGESPDEVENGVSKMSFVVSRHHRFHKL